jgi:hypothetical protein
MNETRPKAIYVEHYGYYWRLTPQEWRQLLRGILSGDGYLLADTLGGGLGRRLAARPHHVYGTRGKTASSRNDLPLYHPLDWGPEEARYALAEVDGGSAS